MSLDMFKMEALDLATEAGDVLVPGGEAAGEIGRILAAGRVVFLPEKLKKARAVAEHSATPAR